MSKIGSPMTKLEIKKFSGKENFSLWQKRVKVLFVQQGLHKTFRVTHQNL